jgi:glutamate synthase (NADPH/NADH) large chain
VEGVGDHGCEYMTGGRVVVLGATGRNFAAGMSGGVAYVYDQDGTFDERVNTELVDVLDASVADRKWLLDIITQHHAATSSPLAKRMMDGWNAAADRFRVVMPRDYARVMGILESARTQGLSEEETLQRVMEPVNG